MIKSDSAIFWKYNVTTIEAAAHSFLSFLSVSLIKRTERFIVSPRGVERIAAVASRRGGGAPPRRYPYDLSISITAAGASDISRESQCVTYQVPYYVNK